MLRCIAIPVGATGWSPGYSTICGHVHHAKDDCCMGIFAKYAPIRGDPTTGDQPVRPLNWQHIFCRTTIPDGPAYPRYTGLLLPEKLKQNNYPSTTFIPFIPTSPAPSSKLTISLSELYDEIRI